MTRGTDMPRSKSRRTPSASSPRPADRPSNQHRESAKSRQGRAPSARPYVVAAARIEQVRSVLGDILQWTNPADVELSRWMRAHPKLGMRDRAEVAEAVFDV